MHWRTEQIIHQLGGFGMGGAFIYTGRNSKIAAAAQDRRPDPSVWDEDHGTLSFETGLMWKVNMGPGQLWKMAVTLEPSDTYTVYYMRLHGPREAAETGKLATLVTKFEDVYCDQLQSIVESTYDEHLNPAKAGLWV
jgi:hypothetical protein